MFQEEYRKAYDNIFPSEVNIEKIRELAEERKENMRASVFYALRPAAVFFLAICLCSTLVLPVAAKMIPGIYRIVEAYAPGLVGFVLPEETSDTGKGITMQVEAIDIVDNTAEILISFRDAEDSGADLICGKVDMYDSYRLQNFGSEWQASGSSFLEYDAVEDKAYFKISITSSDAFDKDRVRFSVRQLLTNCVQEERVIGLDNLIENPKEKKVYLNGIGSARDRSNVPFFTDERNVDYPLPRGKVMDIAGLEESLLEDLVVTGVSYDERVLRVQQCRGNFSDADRHMRPFLRDAEGNEIINDYSVSWQEKINGERVVFDEHWFLISEEELEQCELYGEYWITDGSVKGNWEVTFTLD